jgi:hypothetical protein
MEANVGTPGVLCNIVSQLSAPHAHMSLSGREAVLSLGLPSWQALHNASQQQLQAGATHTSWPSVQAVARSGLGIPNTDSSSSGATAAGACNDQPATLPAPHPLRPASSGTHGSNPAPASAPAHATAAAMLGAAGAAALNSTSASLYVKNLPSGVRKSSLLGSQGRIG